MKLEDKLQQLRKMNGYSQEQLADKIKIARQTISKWENGQAVPELNGVMQLSKLYGITIDSKTKSFSLSNKILHSSSSFTTYYRKNDLCELRFLLANG